MSEPAPVRAAVGITAAGIAGAWLLPGVRLGLGLLLVAVTVTVVIGIASPRAVRPYEIGLGALALALVAMALVRSAEWILVVDVVAAAALAGIAVLGERGWAGSFAAPFRVLGRFPRVPRLVVEPVARRLSERDLSGVTNTIRGGLVAVVLVLVFGALFVSADAAFASFADDLLAPDWNVTLIPYRVLLFLCLAFVCGGLIEARRASVTSEPDDPRDPFGPEPRDRWRVARSEWMIPVVVLDVLFAAFVVVQITVLFGGRHHVLETEGLTYAEYARQGFFQLLAVAGLVLAVVTVVVRVGRPNTRSERSWMQGLLGALCLLTLVVLASALLRLQLYEETYGLTRLRVSVHATIFWLMGIFAFVMIAGALWKASWLPRTAIAFTGVALLAFTLANPDHLIARRNVDRFETSNRIDLSYLLTLSEDAVPALSELPTPERDCVLSLLALFRDTDREDPWNGFNTSRTRAREILDDLNVTITDRATSCSSAGLYQ